MNNELTNCLGGSPATAEEQIANARALTEITGDLFPLLNEAELSAWLMICTPFPARPLPECMERVRDLARRSGGDPGLAVALAEEEFTAAAAEVAPPPAPAATPPLEDEGQQLTLTPETMVEVALMRMALRVLLPTEITGRGSEQPRFRLSVVGDYGGHGWFDVTYARIGKAVPEGQAVEGRARMFEHPHAKHESRRVGADWHFEEQSGPDWRMAEQADFATVAPLLADDNDPDEPWPPVHPDPRRQARLVAKRATLRLVEEFVAAAPDAEMAAKLNDLFSQDRAEVQTWDSLLASHRQRQPPNVT